MCNNWCENFAESVIENIPHDSMILEVGARNVNGSVRQLFEPNVKKYLGVDLFDGDGVDEVLDVADLISHYGVGSFDVVVSTEMIEHCLNWQDALYQMAGVLHPDGLLLITTRSPGFALHDFPSDHWRFSYDDFEKIFTPLGEILRIESDMTLGWSCGIGILVKVKVNQKELSNWKIWLDDVEVYSMASEQDDQLSAPLRNQEKTVIFDQYSRYKACSDLLVQTEFSTGHSILDIGSGPECLFGQFMPDATMNYVDPLIVSGSGPRHIRGNVFSHELDGQFFDCVTAIDVLEHVPPKYRKVFIERTSSLARNTLIFGFPTSDSTTNAQDVDKAINDQYRSIFGQDYSWLEEHYQFGLPSLTKTVRHLEELGWHIQTIGHGHAPWLQELLGFVVCIWDIPSLKKIVSDISEQFNRQLYSYDFRPPYYRQFIIASRNPLPSICVPEENKRIDAGQVFHGLMEYAHKQYFVASLGKLNLQGWVEFDAQLAERDAQLAERDAQLAERDAQLAERDAQLVERDTLVALMKNSTSWRLTRPLRFVARLARYGLISEDIQRLTQRVRYRYHQLPLPNPAKKVVRFAYHKIFSRLLRSVRRGLLQVAQFSAPTTKPAAKQQGLPDYIVWGVLDWHFRYQRPQQVAQALINTGRRVFYVSANLVDDERPGFEVEALGTSGLLFQVRLFVNGAPTIYSSAPGLETIAQLRASIGEVLDWADCSQLISLIQHPFWCGAAAMLPNSRLVYDCMDHHEGFGNTSDSLLQLERGLFGKAQLTVTTSAGLDQSVAEYTQNHVLIRNAGEYKHFSRSPEKVYCEPQNRRIIGYYGAIAEWFDLDLVAEVAKRHPECAVLLIGADTVNSRSRLGKLANITFIGEVPYHKLPYYLHSFDVCILPFKIVPLTLATNPVKVYEYLSAGKPVVCVDLPEMAQFDGLVYVASDPQQFYDTVGAVLDQSEPEELIERRRVFAEGQTWEHRVETLIQYAETAVDEPQVSVIVVTYNNLELTRACLASLDEHNQDNNLEIIVVDNGSNDGSVEFLESWGSSGANRKHILNDDNLGFAAANNQGLRVATGDYLVLLNNDTYVTPGWIRTLVGHLQNDKSIGMIGPVTNNIGNEAKIDLHYGEMSEMIRKSSSYTRRHIGQTYPLRTAAFFCVMMRRETFEQVGELDEAFGCGFFEDDDYCRRIEKAGLRVVCAEDVFIHHHLSASFSKLKHQDRKMLFDKNKKIYEAKWGEWVPHGYRKNQQVEVNDHSVPHVFDRQQYILGQCNVCGRHGRFFYQEKALWRETLNCEHCRTPSRYRSITRGVLRAVTEFSGHEFQSLATLPRFGTQKLRVYDTQSPFYYETSAYPLPDWLQATGWIEVELSQYKPGRPMGEILAKGVTNQNLECLTFADASLDIVITSDVMEHVRLDDCAHMEIYRVLKPGGIYIFTVPHDRSEDKTLVRVKVIDPNDPSKDVQLLEPEFHGDANSDDGGSVLAYRTYGRDIEVYLGQLGFDVEYCRTDIPELGILNTELYYCRKVVL